MKKHFFLAFLCQTLFVYSQVGINTNSPQSELDINGDVTLRKELRIGGTTTTLGNPGQFGQVLFSQEGTNLPIWKFVNVPFLENGQIQLKYSYAMKDQNGILFSNGPGDQTNLSTIGDQLTPNWKVIDGLKTTIEVKKNKNEVAIFFQSGTEIPSTYNQNERYVRYTCGVFLDNKLIAVRGEQIRGVPKKNNKNQEVFTLSRVISNVEVGTHELQVACRKIKTNINGDSTLAIGRSLNYDNPTANDFMLSSNLKVDVMEYIEND